MDDPKKIREYIKNKYNVLDDKQKAKKILCKVSIFALIVSFIKFCISKIILIFT